jgi:hypothetical protein
MPFLEVYTFIFIIIIICYFAVRFDLFFFVIGYIMQSCFDAVSFACKVPSSVSHSSILVLTSKVLWHSLKACIYGRQHKTKMHVVVTQGRM